MFASLTAEQQEAVDEFRNVVDNPYPWEEIEGVKAEIKRKKDRNMRNFEDLQIAVAGTGYVGLSIATLLSQHHKVTAVDVIPEKVEKINNRISPIQDEYIEKYFAEKELNLTATLDGASAYKDADFVVIAAPTNYDPAKNFFDTHHIEDVIDLVLSVNPEATMVIKSTIPVGYCRSLYVKYAQKFAQMVPLARWKTS